MNSLSYKHTSLDGYRQDIKERRQELDACEDLGVESPWVIQLRDEVERDEKRLGNIQRAASEVSEEIRVVLEHDGANNMAAFMTPEKSGQSFMVADHMDDLQMARRAAVHEHGHFLCGIYQVDLNAQLTDEERTQFWTITGMSANELDIVESGVDSWAERRVSGSTGYDGIVVAMRRFDNFVDGPGIEDEMFRDGSSEQSVIDLVRTHLQEAMAA